jgi:hypothetical protein
MDETHSLNMITVALQAFKVQIYIKRENFQILECLSACQPACLPACLPVCLVETTTTTTTPMHKERQATNQQTQKSAFQ